MFPRLVNLKSLVFTVHDANEVTRSSRHGSKVPLAQLMEALPTPKLLEKLIIIGRSFHIGGNSSVSAARTPHLTSFFPSSPIFSSFIFDFDCDEGDPSLNVAFTRFVNLKHLRLSSRWQWRGVLFLPPSLISLDINSHNISWAAEVCFNYSDVKNLKYLSLGVNNVFPMPGSPPSSLVDLPHLTHLRLKYVNGSFHSFSFLSICLFLGKYRCNDAELVNTPVDLRQRMDIRLGGFNLQANDKFQFLLFTSYSQLIECETLENFTNLKELVVVAACVKEGKDKADTPLTFHEPEKVPRSVEKVVFVCYVVPEEEDLLRFLAAVPSVKFVAFVLPTGSDAIVPYADDLVRPPFSLSHPPSAVVHPSNGIGDRG